MEKTRTKDPRLSHRRILVGLLAFLALNLIFYGLVTHPGKRKLRERGQRLADIQQDRMVSLRILEAARADKEQLDRVIEDIDTFYHEILSTREAKMNSVRNEINGLARRYRVNLDEINYPSQEFPDYGVDQFAINFPLSGQFGDVGRFLGDIENSDNFLLIDSVSLRSSDETGRLLNLSFSLETYFCAVDDLQAFLWDRPPRR